MKLRNVLIVVNDVEKAKEFYRDLFGLHVLMDMGENVILTEGLVLQEKKLWESFTGKTVMPGGHDGELYFEETDMDGFLKKLEESKFDIQYVNPMEEVGGRRIVRLYDLDKHVIEVKEV